MNSNSKKTTLLILAIVSLVASRIIFFFINDPEGPNLLVVVGLAAIIFAVSWAAYALYSSKKRV